jgi:hypothetical protein
MLIVDPWIVTPIATSTQMDDIPILCAEKRGFPNEGHREFHDGCEQ